MTPPVRSAGFPAAKRHQSHAVRTRAPSYAPAFVQPPASFTPSQPTTIRDSNTDGGTEPEAVQASKQFAIFSSDFIPEL